MAEAELKLSGFLGRETFSQQHSRGSGGVLDHAATRAPVYWRVAARFTGSFARHRIRYGDIDRCNIARSDGALQLDVTGLTLLDRQLRSTIIRFVDYLVCSIGQVPSDE